MTRGVGVSWVGWACWRMGNLGVGWRGTQVGWRLTVGWRRRAVLVGRWWGGVGVGRQ